MTFLISAPSFIVKVEEPKYTAPPEATTYPADLLPSMTQFSSVTLLEPEMAKARMPVLPNLMTARPLSAVVSPL